MVGEIVEDTVLPFNVVSSHEVHFKLDLQRGKGTLLEECISDEFKETDALDALLWHGLRRTALTNGHMSCSTSRRQWCEAEGRGLRRSSQLAVHSPYAPRSQ